MPADKRNEDTPDHISLFPGDTKIPLRPSGIDIKDPPEPDILDLVLQTGIHDTRNLLGAALGVELTILEGDNLTLQQRQDLEQFFRAARLASEILNATMSLMREKKGQFRLDRKHFELSPVIKDIIETHHCGQRFIVDVCPDAELVFGDQYNISRVLSNLIGNAIKYSPSAERITISVINVIGTIMIKIIDKGDGLPKDVDLFHPYAHGKQTNHGWGLGLAYCKMICEKHGGRITAVNNRFGKGSCLTIYLPPSTQL